MDDVLPVMFALVLVSDDILYVGFEKLFHAITGNRSLMKNPDLIRDYSEYFS